MTYNLSAYVIYLSITFFITVRVGWMCYVNGEVFIRQIIDDLELVTYLNRFLLIGYYLLNLGYLSMSILDWQTITSSFELINTVSERVGQITIFLALMHYFNIGIISIFGRRFNL